MAKQPSLRPSVPSTLHPSLCALRWCVTAGWTLHFAWVTGLTVANNSVLAPSDSPNTDGMDLDCVQDAIVHNNFVSTGDDALCVKSGIDWFGRTFGRPSANILFADNVVGTGHGISIGSETSGSVTNVTFERIRLNGTSAGPRIKTQRGRGGVISDVVYRDIVGTSLGGTIRKAFVGCGGGGRSAESSTVVSALHFCSSFRDHRQLHPGHSADERDGDAPSGERSLSEHHVHALFEHRLVL